MLNLVNSELKAELYISYQHLVRIPGFVRDKAAVILLSACDMSSSGSLMVVEASTSRRGAWRCAGSGVSGTVHCYHKVPRQKLEKRPFQAKILVVLVCKLSFQFLLRRTSKIFSIKLLKLETLYVVCCSGAFPWSLMVTVCTEFTLFRWAAWFLLQPSPVGSSNHDTALNLDKCLSRMTPWQFSSEYLIAVALCQPQIPR